ncbi:MAG: hypothetical protein P4N24_13565 [Acidobacteriota bacterium]|nr:hypothetical protein [Acidobacteriota bacterium]
MEKSAATGSDGRRSTRLSISLPVVIHGKDAEQNTFREDTHTLIVNQHGAKIATAHKLTLGAEVLVENTALGSVAKANVVWVSSKPNAGGLNEVGVQLVEAQNIWGLEFPPEDWTAKGKDQGTPEVKVTPPPPVPAPRPVPKGSKPAQAPPATSTSEVIATQLLNDLYETTDAHLRQFSEKLDQIVQRIGLKWEKELRERASAAREREMAAIQQHVLASNDQLSGLKAELEDLNVRLAESQRIMLAAEESLPLPFSPVEIQEKIQEQALPVLHLITESGIATGRERFQAQVQADATQALDTWRRNLQAERDALVKEARQQIATVAASALEEMTQDRETGFTGLKRRIEEEIRGSQERAAAQITLKLDETVASHGDILVMRLNDTVRETGERQTNLLQTQLDALLVSRLDQAQRHAQSMGETLQNSVEEGLRAIGEKRSQELQAQLQEIVGKTIASASNEVRGRVEESVGAAAEKSLNEWQSRLQEITDKVLASSSDQIRAQVEEAAKAASDNALQSCQLRLQDIAEKIVVSTSSQLRAQVEESAQAVADKNLKAWQSTLQEISDKTVASSSAQIRAQVEETAKAATESAVQSCQSRLQDIVDKTVTSSSNQITAKVEESAQAAADNALKTWDARLHEVADRVVDSSSERIRGQIEEAARGAAERELQTWQTRLQDTTDKAVAASSEQIRVRVEESAQSTADKAVAAWQARLQGVADNAAASASEQIQDQIKEALHLMGPKLQEMQDRAVADAVETFRGLLSQILGLLPSAGSK